MTWEVQLEEQMYVFRLVRRPNTEQRFVSLHAGWHNKVFCFIFGCNNLTVNYTYIVFTAKESHAPAQPPAGWCHGAENVGPEASVSAGLAKALWCRPLVYRHTPWMRKAVLFSCSAKLCVNMTLLIQGAPPRSFSLSWGVIPYLTQLRHCHPFFVFIALLVRYLFSLSHRRSISKQDLYVYKRILNVKCLL